MKKFLTGLCLVVAMCALGGDVQPEATPITLEKAYLPLGFDSNDQSQVVVAGKFPNTCYQLGQTTAKVEKDTITVTQQALVYQGTCLRVTVPFDQVVDVGILQPGDYNVVDGNSGRKLGVLNVVEATSAGVGTDDLPYAPVRDVFLTKDGETGNFSLILQGAFTNRCMKLKKVEVKDQPDVLVVLPIAEMVEGDDCKEGIFRFQEKKALKRLEDKAYLLHVRAMNGKALNKMHYGDSN